MKSFTSIIAATLLSVAFAADPDKTISFEGKVADVSFKNKQNITIFLDETSKCDMFYKALPWSVQCSLGIRLESSGLLNLNSDKLNFNATVGAMISSEDVIDSRDATQQKLTFNYLAETPGFDFGENWEKWGAPKIEPKRFPADGGKLEIVLPAHKLSKGLCLSTMEDELTDAGVQGPLLTSAKIVEGTSRLSGNDVCSKVHGLTIDEQQMGAQLQLILQIDLLNENKVDFDKWGLGEGIFDADAFRKARSALFKMDKPFSKTINIGAAVHKLITEKMIKEAQSSDRRMLLASVEGPDAFVDMHGNFMLGSFNFSEDNGNSASTSAASIFAMLLVIICAMVNIA